MKLINIFLIIAVIGMIFLAGCSNSAGNSDDNKQYWGSGGCGVAPIDGNNNEAAEGIDSINNIEL